MQLFLHKEFVISKKLDLLVYKRYAFVVLLKTHFKTNRTPPISSNNRNVTVSLYVPVKLILRQIEHYQSQTTLNM